MFIANLRLLPKKSADREALTHTYSNIKPRLNLSIVEGLRRLTQNSLKLSLTGLVFLLLFNYSPNITFPFLKQSVVYAQNADNSIPFLLPHDGYISSKFTTYHPGIDIATNLGSSIHPISSGIVEEVLFGNVGYGNHVIITHPNGYQSLYGHMGQILVVKGQAVTNATILGTVGLTGRTSGPHTHLEISKDGKNINPIGLLPTLSDIPNSSFFNYTGGGLPVTTKPTPTPEPKLAKTLKPDFN